MSDHAIIRWTNPRREKNSKLFFIHKWTNLLQENKQAALEEREKPELNRLLAFLKIFHGFAVAFFLIHARLCVRVYTSPESADLNGRCCVYNKYTKSILYIAGRFSIQLNIFLASQIRKSYENNVTT